MREGERRRKVGEEVREGERREEGRGGGEGGGKEEEGRGGGEGGRKEGERREEGRGGGKILPLMFNIVLCILRSKLLFSNQSGNKLVPIIKHSNNS